MCNYRANSPQTQSQKLKGYLTHGAAYDRTGSSLFGSDLPRTGAAHPEIPPPARSTNTRTRPVASHRQVGVAPPCLRCNFCSMPDAQERAMVITQSWHSMQHGTPCTAFYRRPAIVVYSDCVASAARAWIFACHPDTSSQRHGDMCPGTG